MDVRTLSYVERACSGRLRGAVGGHLAVRRVCSDSRQAGPGDLFAAIPGERFDGHEFIPEVLARGVTAVLAQSERLPASLSADAVIVEVEDTRRALGRLAAAYRRDFDLPVVAVGGSNGKTTTKEMIASVLSRRFPVLWSEASFNNDIGVPFTLLRMTSEHRAAVLELGTNHPGELEALVEMTRPRYGVVTSLGREHLEHFGSMDGVIEEEGALAARLPRDGTLFLNADSEGAEALARRAPCAVVRVGWEAGLDWRASDWRLAFEGTHFRLDDAPDGFEGDYFVPLLGRHQVTNAMLALAVGRELGLTADQARAGLAACPTPKSRLAPTQHRGICILDDSYNANADSMIAGLRTLQQLPCAGRRVAVIGDMAELGDHTLAAHEEVGRVAGELGIDCLVGLGRNAAATVESAIRAGTRVARGWSEAPEAIVFLKEYLKPGDVVLIKASRAAGLEKIAQLLKTA
ncbi:MAG: UDP-N-acetylmuramoyl-tripeptide--D-alanyl-D-alanine ligase [Verrucomicrobia bacterium]|nr:UDP-N-acetylmuramoyl-tripeptide--D-alanyl-D-alanine ligase [Verrucomicrobiota bacterium]MBI3867728.1 UDP-N-acetylmuramoyl-tripeptide--D-alanyl-D-alanine ligase [Verrucomicrobiota bacterium]